MNLSSVLDSGTVHFQGVNCISMLKSLTIALAAASLATAAPAQQAGGVEVVDLPPSSEQGIDMVYTDDNGAPLEPELATEAPPPFVMERWSDAPLDMFSAVHPLYTQFRQALMRYRMDWGTLPDVQISDGPAMKPGDTGPRVALLRDRFAMMPGETYDSELERAVRKFQGAHGLKVDGIAGASVVTTLNLGPQHFERVLMINMERARKLPANASRYILVDAGAARMWLYENGRPVDSMKVIVGSKVTPTPMMAATLQYVSLQPYWNVPPDFLRKTTAPRVLQEGVRYLTDREYEVLSDWSDNAKLLDPATVDWQAVADGRLDVRIRRKPSPANSMGLMKFNMPNHYGIYLHDTPDKTLFAKDDRWVSNGCIRVEDYKKLATWLFGSVPKPTTGEPEERVDLPQPVPVYVTYMTAGIAANGPVFRPDPYDRDGPILANWEGGAISTAARR
jgi:L,D-transpeptidase YcbB